MHERKTSHAVMGSGRRPGRRGSLATGLCLLAAAALTFALLAGPAAARGGQVKVETVRIGNKRVLANGRGHTLYSLSAETNGRFICTKRSGCLGIWTPLLIPRGSSVSGPVKLGSVTRPEGTRQVTYRGLPLYTFDQDTRRGQASGEGIKDVGTWHAATVSGG